VRQTGADPETTSDAKKRRDGQRKIIEILGVGATSLLLVVFAFDLVGRGLIPKEEVLPTYIAIVASVGGYLFIRLVSGILERNIEPKLGVTRTNGAKNLFQIVGGIIIIIVVFGVFGLNITGVLIGAGFLGIVLGLAAQQVLGNIFAGISMLGSRPFEIGDRVTIVTSSYGLLGSSYAHETEINGFTGTVQDVGIFLTHVLLDAGTPSVFPNSVIISSLIINHSHVIWRVVRVRIDLDKVKVNFSRFRPRLLERLAKYDKLIDVTKSKIEMVEIGTSTYNVMVSAWAKSSLEEPIKTLLIEEIMTVQQELEGT
jgi:small-conductance mechanosensitive channel